MGKSSKAYKIARIAVFVAMAVMFLYIFYNEATKNFSSDIPAHIRFATSDTEPGYSLIYPFLAFSYNTGSHMGVAIFLTILELVTIYLCERFMRRLLPDVREEVVFALAIVANIVVAIYIPIIHPHFSKGLSTGNAWHNSTFMGMKILSLLAVWFYLRFVDYLESDHKVLDWTVMTVCIVASAAVKPSFVVVFGPTVVILCVIDLVKNGPKTLKRSLALSVPFFMVLGILLYQYTLLYVEDTSSGIELGFAVVWRHSHPFFPLGILQSYAFPLLVMVFCLKDFKDDFNYRMTLIMFFIGLAIFLFVNETGKRMYHGNFAWSLKFAVYYLFIVSIVVYFKKYAAKFPLFLKEPAATAYAGVSSVPANAAASAEVAAASAEGSDTGPDASLAAGEGSVAPPVKRSVFGEANFWPELFILFFLGLHFLSGCGSLLKIMIGHGYG